MTKEEKKHYVLLSRRRYGELTDKKDKGAFLDQFCAVTGMSRKNAIRRLSPRERPHRRRGRPFKADITLYAALHHADFCSKGGKNC